MARPRHKHVLRAPSPWRSQRLLRFGLPAAAVLAVGSSAVAMNWADMAPAQSSAAISMAVPKARTSPVPVRIEPISRSAVRTRLVAKPPEVVGHMFATTKLNVRSAPSDSAPLVDVLDWAAEVSVSGRTQGDWSEIVVGDKGLWVHTAYLAEK